jgi:parallel beta-helix repeat protein
MGVQNVVVTACDFSDNGSSVAPGPGLQHNLLITHVTDCRISDSRLVASPWGNGLELIHSRNVTISNNETARNSLNGIHSTESQDIHVRGNLTEGNDRNGILFDAQMDGCSWIDVCDNLARNNGEHGISINRVTGGTIQNNTVVDNGQN